MLKETKILIIMNIIKAFSVIVMLTAVLHFVSTKYDVIIEFLNQELESVQYIKRYPGK